MHGYALILNRQILHRLLCDLFICNCGKQTRWYILVNSYRAGIKEYYSMLIGNEHIKLQLLTNVI